MISSIVSSQSETLEESVLSVFKFWCLVSKGYTTTSPHQRATPAAVFVRYVMSPVLPIIVQTTELSMMLSIFIASTLLILPSPPSRTTDLRSGLSGLRLPTRAVQQ